MKKLILMVTDEKSVLVEQLCATIAEKVVKMRLPDIKGYLHINGDNSQISSLNNEYMCRYLQKLSLEEYKELFPEEYERSYKGTANIRLTQAKRDVLFSVIEQMGAMVVGLEQLKIIKKGIVVSALSAKELEDSLPFYQKLFGEEEVVVMDKIALGTAEDIERQAGDITAKLFPHISKMRPIEGILDTEEIKVFSPSRFMLQAARAKSMPITWDKKTTKKFIKDNCRAFFSAWSMGSEYRLSDMFINTPEDIKEKMISYLLEDIKSSVCSGLSILHDKYTPKDIILYKKLSYIKENSNINFAEIYNSLGKEEQKAIDSLLELSLEKLTTIVAPEKEKIATELQDQGRFFYKSLFSVER